MNSYHHPSAPHIICTGGWRSYTYVSDSAELTHQIAEAAKASLCPSEIGSFTRNSTKVRVSPPDMDSDQYAVAFEITEKENTLIMLPSIHALADHLKKNLAPLHLTITEDRPPFFDGTWLSWTIAPTQAAAFRAQHIAAVEEYRLLGEAARRNDDGGGGLMDEYANTEEPSIANLLSEHIRTCESLVTGAANLSKWEDHHHEHAPELAALFGTGKTTTTIAEQAASQAAAIDRAAWQARRLQALAS